MSPRHYPGESTMPGFDPSAALRASRALSDFERLNQLDDIWTSYLFTVGPVSSADREALDEITGEMRKILGRVGAHTDFLQGIINGNQFAFEQAYRTVLAVAPLSANQRGSLDAVVNEEGGATLFANRELTLLREQSEEEAGQLRDKMDRIRAVGGTVQGDLSFRFKCALGITILAGSICLLVASGVVLLPAVVAAVQAGAGATAIVAAFTAHGGATATFVVKGSAVAYDTWHLLEGGCFRPDKWKQ